MINKQMLFKDRISDKKLSYVIEDYSSFTSTYKPSNIQTDDPTSPSSRWSTSATNLGQYIILRLEVPAIVTKIIFGKFHKVHVCNVKEINIYSISKEESLILKCYLKNDPEKEAFNVKYATENKFIISDKIKINPLSSWGMNFNYSIWYVELRGYDLIESFIQYNSLISYYLSCRVLLKFLKNQGIEVHSLEEDLSSRFNQMISDESPELTNNSIKSGNVIVKNEMSNLTDAEINDLNSKIKVFNKPAGDNKGMNLLFDKISHESKIIAEIKRMIYEDDFNNLEKYLEEKSFLFDDYLERSEYLIQWKLLDSNMISSRGGHQMIEYKNGLLLYGGWDGEKDLDDLWFYMVDAKKWIKIDGNSLPGKRSCHKMCNINDKVYLFGRYIPAEASRNSSGIEKVMYVYNGVWGSFTFSNGVNNLYEHQMVGESRTGVFGENFKLYIFGGRTQNDQSYSGLFRFENGAMEAIRPNKKVAQTSPELKGRVGHSLILIPKNFFPEEENYYKNILKSPSFFNNSLLVIGGHRGKDYYKEITFYSIEHDNVYMNIPFPINCEGRMATRSVLRGNDIVIFVSYSKERDKLTDTTVLIYNLKLRKWIDTTHKGISPAPRTASQFACVNDKLFLLGGNTGNTTKRANDFWELLLIKPTKEELINELKFIIRRHCYLNMDDKKEALLYIKEKIHILLNDRLLDQYKALCCEIIKGRKETKKELINKLINYLPKDLCEVDIEMEELIK